MNSRHLTVADLMTQEVLRAGVRTSLKELATTFTEHHVTAVPVADDDDRVIGVVSEADLLHHEAAQHDPYGRDPDLPAAKRKGADRETAGEVMTVPATTAKRYWNVVEAARTMDQHKVDRLPVVEENGQLIGMISRGDLMRVFLRSDASIRSEITDEVLGHILAIEPGEVEVEVADGVVTLRGRISSPRVAPVLVRLCRGVDGVVAVHDRLRKPPDGADRVSDTQQPVGREAEPTDQVGNAPVDDVSFQARTVETHTAVVFFFADRAYKVKKPVDLGFLNFTTSAARHAACQRELELNRRFAPDVYLGLAQIYVPGETQPEPLVVMRRMPDSRRLAHLISVGAPVDDALRDVARLLAARHAEARSSADVRAEGTRDALLGRWEENFKEMRTLVDGERALSELAEIEHRVRDYLAGRQPLFDARIHQGRVIEGHGDLLAQDIFCLDDGPRLLDCLEFDDRLRYVDGLDDAAFLAMDLEQLGASEAAAEFLSRYREYSGDPAPSSLWHHYIAYRALVRAKVSLIQARQGIAGATAAAGSLIDAVLQHLRTSAIRLILVGGLPASGKSTISGALADRLETSLLSTDRLRKELVGLSPDERAPAAYREGIYTPEQTSRTYEVLLDRATALLRHGESVVLDATWNSREQREAAVKVARRADAELFTLRCEVPDDVAMHRLEQRTRGPSDADPQVAEAMATESDPWREAVSIDTSAPIPAVVNRAVSAVRPRASA